ncbi:Hypothetical predicted protein [Cloeon dipterum]|uniref:C-type lectin domain-containing protein n=1 Tax=Cloeon dipterum TaxID=197152 RepID=A0A8S1DC24_9INSE|nr:Hypothetical predicted protein [Cloeon dipterum]
MTAIAKDRVKHISDRFFKCGHYYYFGISKVTFKDAVTVCTQRRMSLASFSGGEKHRQCLIEPKPRIAQLSFGWLQNEKTPLVWTSGMSEGKPTCKEAAYSWCALPNGRIDPERVGLSRDVSADKCLAFKKETGLIRRQPCDAKLSFYCEHKCTAPFCPSSNTCKKDASLFSADGKLKQGASLGNWLQFSYKNGNVSYLFAHKRMSWSENLNYCCKFGMKPIVVTDAFLENFRQITISGTYFMGKSALDLANFYWTAATRQGCVGHYKFCLHDDIGPWDSKEKFWSLINTVAAGSCLMLKQSMKLYSAELDVSQISCTSRLINAACESRNKSVEQLISPPNKKELGCSQQPACETINCNPDLRRLVRNGNEGYILARPKSVGEWKKSCGVYHLIPNVKMSWNAARSFCCSISMRLVSIYSLEKQFCLHEVLQQSDPKTQFWTSGTDRPCPGVFRWCAGTFLDYLKPNLQWRKNRGNASCVTLQNDAIQGAVLGTEKCDQELSFVCESRPSSAIGTFSMVVEECKAVNRLTLRDKNKLQMDQIDSFTYKMKCHLQCVAELGGLIYGGENFILDNVVKYLLGSNFEIAELYETNYYFMNTKNANEAIAKYGGFWFVSKMMASMSKMSAGRDSSGTIRYDLMSRFERCLKSVTTGRAECTYVFEFARCMLNGSDFANKEWANVNRIEMSGSADWNSAFTLPPNTSNLMVGNLLRFSPVPSDLYLNTDCTLGVLENTQTTLSACLSLNGGFNEFFKGQEFSIFKSVGAIITSNIFLECKRMNGYILFATSPEEFQRIYRLLNSTHDTLWGDAFVDPDGVLRWCDRPEARVPVTLASGTELLGQLPFVLISRAGDVPNLHAVPIETGLKMKKPFCRVEKSFVDVCLSNPEYQPLWQVYSNLTSSSGK